MESILEKIQDDSGMSKDDNGDVTQSLSPNESRQVTDQEDAKLEYIESSEAILTASQKKAEEERAAVEGEIDKIREASEVSYQSLFIVNSKHLMYRKRPRKRTESQPERCLTSRVKRRLSKNNNRLSTRRSSMQSLRMTHTSSNTSISSMRGIRSLESNNQDPLILLLNSWKQ